MSARWTSRLEERAPRVEQPVDSLPRGQLAARAVPFERLVASASRDERGPLANLCDERLHPVAALDKDLRFALDLRREHAHGAERSGRGGQSSLQFR